MLSRDGICNLSSNEMQFILLRERIYDSKHNSSITWGLSLGKNK